MSSKAIYPKEAAPPMAAAGLLGPDLVSFPCLNGLSEAQRNYYQLRATICHSSPFGSQQDILTT